MKQVRVNVRTLANAAAIRREKRNGRDVIIVPSATLPDDVVMNGSSGAVMYPAAEIAKSFQKLERSPAPLGHPVVNGKYVSAKDPEGINAFWVGAWNENVRQDKGRVMLDKVIDVERAGQSEGGKRLLNAIEKGGPIHTSTGLLANMEAVTGKSYKFIARNMEFDHDAILLDEKGAATPDQGVGMLVNSKGEQTEIEVINSVIDDDFMQEVEWAAESVRRALERREERKEDKPLLERIKSAIMEALGRSERDTSIMEKDDMAVNEKQFEELSAKVESLSESVAGIGDKITEAVTNAVKPLTDANAELVANQKAKDDAELADLQAKIVKANLMDEATAKELTLNAAKALSAKAVAGKAFAMNGGFTPTGDKPGFQLPEGGDK